MVLLAGDRGEVTLGIAMISDEVVQDIARQVWDLGKGNSNISGSLDVVEAHTRAVLEIAGRDGVVAEGEDESSFTE
jgi:hypothetical protein